MADPDFFEILGAPRRYHLDLADVERSFHERSKQLHPDRHAQADSQTRVRNALAATELNQAWRTLKSDISRAEYLLSLEGIVIADERGGPTVANSFLLEIMELREALTEARVAVDHPRVHALAADVGTRSRKVRADLAAAFADWEQPGAAEPYRRAALRNAADALIAERYFRRFLEEVEAFEDSHSGA